MAVPWIRVFLTHPFTVTSAEVLRLDHLTPLLSKLPWPREFKDIVLRHSLQQLWQIPNLSKPFMLRMLVPLFYVKQKVPRCFMQVS